MMLHVLRSKLDPAWALEDARKGLSIYSDQLELATEKIALEEFDHSMLFKSCSFGIPQNL